MTEAERKAVIEECARECEHGAAHLKMFADTVLTGFWNRGLNKKYMTEAIAMKVCAMSIRSGMPWTQAANHLEKDKA